MDSELNAADLGIFLNGELVGATSPQEVEITPWVEPKPVKIPLKGVKIVLNNGNKIPRKIKKKVKTKIRSYLNGFFLN